MRDYEYINDFGLIEKIENFSFNFVDVESKYRFTASNVDRYRKIVKEEILNAKTNTISIIYLFILLNRWK